MLQRPSLGIIRQSRIATYFRQRHYWKSMELLQPPAVVRGMRALDRAAFAKTISVPRLRVSDVQACKVLPLVRKLLLKMEQLRPVRPLDLDGCEMREILLHPVPVKTWECLPIAELQELDVCPADFYYGDLHLTYENWRADEIFKSILPLDCEGFTSFSRIGHIVHLNLRDHLLPYKAVIGQVLIDKVSGCRTVVNKTANIQTTYRYFQLELVSGVPNYKVETKENGTWFEFDFSRVYWNPRLSTEHERIVQLLRPGDVLYDVFAGVGPFSVPAAKKRCIVYANDLNPESYAWLQQNFKRNKCHDGPQIFNKDGRDFILENIKEDLLARWQSQTLDGVPPYAIHITMNLPAMAPQFLPAFRGLFEHEAKDLHMSAENFNFPIVHVYTFARGDNTKMMARALVEERLGFQLDESFLLGIHFVRNVAPKKDMYRVTMRLTEKILTTPLRGEENEPAELQDAAPADDPQTSRKRAATPETDPADVELRSTKTIRN